MYDYVAVREAVVNAIVHNDCLMNMLQNLKCLVIISNIIKWQYSTIYHKKEFLEGYSLPKNKELMKVFNVRFTYYYTRGIIKFFMRTFS